MSDSEHYSWKGNRSIHKNFTAVRAVTEAEPISTDRGRKMKEAANRGGLLEARSEVPRSPGTRQPEQHSAQDRLRPARREYYLDEFG